MYNIDIRIELTSTWIDRFSEVRDFAEKRLTEFPDTKSRESATLKYVRDAAASQVEDLYIELQSLLA